jgi:large subunit ribosomal protein L17
MRHLKKVKKFGRKRNQRKAFIKSLTVNLIERGKIRTTETRAKAIRKSVERLITYGKKQNLAGLRLLLKKLPKKTAFKVYHELAPRYQSRTGGYTRVTKISKRRLGDGAKTAFIEFV